VREGAVIVYPTDSGYALGCPPRDKEAVARIARYVAWMKKHHMTLVCRDLSELARYARVDNACFRFIEKQHAGQLYLHFGCDQGSAAPFASIRSAVRLACVSPDQVVALAFLLEDIERATAQFPRAICLPDAPPIPLTEY